MCGRAGGETHISPGVKHSATGRARRARQCWLRTHGCATIAAMYAAEHGTADPEALRVRQSNNAMQLTRGGGTRVQASSSPRVIVHEGEVVRPSQLIRSVRRTPRVAEW